MKIRIFTAALLFLSLNIFSQDLKITGTVLDHQTGEPLVGAIVKHLSSGHEVITDFDGNFSIPGALVGANELEVSYISYKQAKLNRVIVQEGKDVLLTIKMKRVDQDHQNQNFFAVSPTNEPRS